MSVLFDRSSMGLLHVHHHQQQQQQHHPGTAGRSISEPGSELEQLLVRRRVPPAESSGIHALKNTRVLGLVILICIL